MHTDIVNIVYTELYKDELLSTKNILVKGVIVFDEETRPFFGATVYVRLEDVSLQDAPSKLIAEQVLRNISYDKDDYQGIKFEIHDNVLDDNARYSISAHVDVDNDGKISKCDFITTQSYPVITYGYPDNLKVGVKRVR
jgi:uncharacterized lipoprotein YbaY